MFSNRSLVIQRYTIPFGAETYWGLRANLYIHTILHLGILYIIVLYTYYNVSVPLSYAHIKMSLSHCLIHILQCLCPIVIPIIGFHVHFISTERTPPRSRIFEPQPYRIILPFQTYTGAEFRKHLHKVYIIFTWGTTTFLFLGISHPVISRLGIYFAGSAIRDTTWRTRTDDTFYNIKEHIKDRSSLGTNFLVSSFHVLTDISVRFIGG